MLSQTDTLIWKNDVPTKTVYFTNEFLIVIQVRLEMHICNLAAGFCAVHNNPSVAKTWTLNRLGKSIWSYYWHFLSNLNNTRKTLVKPATGWGRRHVSAMYTCGVWQTARSKLLRIHCALYAFCEDDLCTNLDKLLKGKHRKRRR